MRFKPIRSLSLLTSLFLLFSSPAFALTTINSKGVVSSEPIRGRNLITTPMLGIATTATLPAVTYANGTLGIGATLTASAVGALTVNGTPIVLNTVFLVKDQVLPVQNGVYLMTTEGNGSTAFVLTRDISGDEAQEIPGSVVSLSNGTSFFVATLSAPVMGTTDIVYTQSVTAPASLTGAVTSIGAATSLGSFTLSALNTALSDADVVSIAGTETVTGAKTFSLAPTFSTMTSGSVLFSGTGGTLTQDNANLFWNDTSNTLGIGTASPNEKIEIADSAGGRGIFSDGAGANRKALLFQSPGTSNPGHARLLAYNYATSAGLDLVINDPGGRVGIGTAPITTLSILSTQPSTTVLNQERLGFRLASEGTNIGARLGLWSASSSENPSFRGFRSRGTLAAPTAVLAADLLAEISGFGYDGSVFSFGSMIQTAASENWTTTAHGSSITISTVPIGSISPLPRLVINNSGNVGVSTSNPDQGKVEVNGGTVCVDTNSDNNASSCIASESDVRLKKNITPITDGLSKVLQLNPVAFDWRVGEIPDYTLLDRFVDRPHSVGFIAQEIKEIIPEGIMEDAPNGYMQYDSVKVIPYLVEAIKTLNARIAVLEAN